MTTRQPKVHTQLGRAAVQIFAANDRINQILIEHLDPAAWRAKPPGKARTIAAIFTHMHNVRSKWVRLTAPHLKVPPQLNRAHCTPQQARAGLAESGARCAEMLAEALGGCGGRVEEFRRGLGPGRLAWKCCATCFLTKPTIAGRCVCSRTSSGSRCRKRWHTGSGIGKSCGKSAGRPAAPATIPVLANGGRQLSISGCTTPEYDLVCYLLLGTRNLVLAISVAPSKAAPSPPAAVGCRAHWAYALPCRFQHRRSRCCCG